MELMAAFGSPGFGIGPDRFVEYHQFVDWMFPNYPKPAPKSIEFSRTPSFLVPISEAIQLLQNSELVAIFCRLGNSSPDLRHVATRLGMATLVAATPRSGSASRTAPAFSQVYEAISPG